MNSPSRSSASLETDSTSLDDNNMCKDPKPWNKLIDARKRACMRGEARSAKGGN